MSSNNLPDSDDCDVILGNANSRFSGVTSTMLQNLPWQQEQMAIRVLGEHHLPDSAIALSFREAVKLCRRPRADGKARVFHARRNNEMLQGLILRRLSGRAKLKLIFTSTAQRYHSGFTRWLMSKMDAVLSTCDAAASYMVRKPDTIIPHGVNTSLYQPLSDPSSVLAERGVTTSRALGIFGRVRPQKGVHLFVRACIESLPRNPDYTALIVGAIAPDQREFVSQLEQEIARAGLSDRIRFLGEQPFADLPSLIASMSLVCALSEVEGYGLTVPEAMSSGAAVLATRAGAWPEIVREGIDGHLVAANDMQAITRTLGSMLENPAQLQTMGEAGRQRALQYYRIEDEARALCDFYRSLQ